MGAKATIHDVAKTAGVAVGTVSNHLNGSVYVSPQMAEKIDKAIARLGYRIHLGARSLRSRRTHTVGLVLPSISNPFYAEVARAVENSLWQRGYQMLLCYTALDEDRERMHLDALESRRVDGVFLIHSAKPPQEQLKRMSMPVVCLDRLVEGQLSVTTDNLLGGWLAARHLTALGHRRIAILAGQATFNDRNSSASFEALGEMASAEAFNVRERLQGFMAVLKELPGVEKPQILTGPEQAVDLGYQVGRILERGRHAPTAIFATNDIVAVGAWRSLLELGIRIPQDMSIIGYDDIEMTRLLIPPLTTVAQDKVAMAEEATALLLRILEKGSPGTKEQQVVRIPPRLVVRASTALPRSADGGEVRARRGATKRASKPPTA